MNINIIQGSVNAPINIDNNEKGDNDGLVGKLIAWVKRTFKIG